MITSRPATPEAYQLLHEGALAFADIEANGMRVDTEYLTKTIKETRDRVRALEADMRADPLFKLWRQRFGSGMKLGANEQLGAVIFDMEKHPRKKGVTSNDEAAFEQVMDIPLVKTFFTKQKLAKGATTLKGIEKEMVDGFIHCFFNLHTVITYRSSSSEFNFQNLQVRNEEIAELIRRTFIARDGYQIIENDFGGIEVRVVACYNKDPVLMDYICDPAKDMHRDMAAAAYKLKPEQVTKQGRYCGKNMLVFPEFYGSYYIDCARNLWEACERMHLQTVDGTPLRRHLEQKGITELGQLDPKKTPRQGSFEAHIKQVEEKLWRTFSVYAKWKKRWWERYLENGYLETLTGFVLSGVYRRNQIINSPVQGSAFHITLKTLILLNRELKKRKMRSRVVGQIQDSIIGDVHRREKDDYLQLVKEIATRRVPNLWKWINVPLEIEAEVSPPGGSWHDKKQVEI